jgi:hypothetical protein
MARRFSGFWSGVEGWSANSRTPAAPKAAATSAGNGGELLLFGTPHMLPRSGRIEHAIYSFIDQIDPHEERSTSWGTLESQVGQPNITVLLRLLKDLLAEGRLESKKWLSTSDCRTYPDLNVSDAEFFFHGDFRLFLTAKGRRRYEELTPKVKAQDRIDKVLELESKRYTDAASQVEHKVRDQLADISGKFHGFFRKAKILELRLDEIEALIRERVKLRRESIAYTRDLLSSEYMDELRDIIMKMVDGAASLKSLMPGDAANDAIRLSSRNNRDELQHLRELADSLLRQLQLEQEMAQPPGKPLVFISCGQYTDQEKALGKAIAAVVEELTPCEGYFAEDQNSLQGLTQHIFGALNRAAGFIAVMHHRGGVATPSGKHIRGSVWVEQEIAIAAFLAQAQNRDVSVLVYIQKGIEREGVRQQLRLKPVEFEREAEVLADLRGQIANRTFEPVTGSISGPSARRGSDDAIHRPG